jgi:type 1 glutamine amidotransferase
MGSPPTALVFNKAIAFIHESIGPASKCAERLLQEAGFLVTVSNDSSLLERGGPAYDLIVLVNNSGDIFDPKKETLTAHVEAGRPVIGIHAALACFLDGEDAVGGTPMGSTCSVIQDIFGAHFKNHPPPQTGKVTIHHERADKASAQFATLPGTFDLHDEFFNFSRDPSDIPGLQVLASVDESTYDGGLHGRSHPVVWYRELGPNRARVFYCALGHFSSFYDGTGSPYVCDILRAGVAAVAEPVLAKRRRFAASGPRVAVVAAVAVVAVAFALRRWRS